MAMLASPPVAETVVPERVAATAPPRPPHVLVCIAGGRDDLRLMRHGALLATRLAARLTVLYVLCPAVGPRPAEALAVVRQFADALRASVVEVPAFSVADGITDYSSARQITHVVLSAPDHTPWFAVWRESVADELLRRLPAEVDVYVLGDDELRRDPPGR